MRDDNWIWWKNGVVYCLYPRSFYDSNNDGIGDLNGIIQKLDYLVELGIDAIWLTPIYKSPKLDCGYDVEDYCKIDEDYGTLDDFKELILEAHSRNIRVVLDLIMNHTSYKHDWFLESSSSRDNPKNDWYIWVDPVNGKPPNNWRNAFGGSAWEYEPRRDQFYLHSFMKEQPDLNWRNEELKEAFFNIIRFWLELGVDGFRLDAVNMIIKDKKFRNNPGFFVSMITKQKFQSRNRDKSIEILKEFRSVLDSYPDKMSVGEIYMLPPGDSKLIAKYLSNGNDCLDLAFDFSLIYKPWSSKSYNDCIKSILKNIPANGWPTIVFSNHDLLRNINRLKWRSNQIEKAKATAVLTFTLKGTPFLYYGDELGMVNGNIPKKDIHDTLGKKFWPFFNGRDQSRTPMQWDSGNFAGFSNVKSWLPVNKDYLSNNYESQKNDPDSMYNLHRSLIKLRKEHSSLNKGKWISFNEGQNGILAYKRKDKSETILVILNFTSKEKNLGITDNSIYRLLLSTGNRGNSDISLENIILQRFEALVLLERRVKDK